ncbi:MAG TPA: TOBE domain-containing protein [Aquabacterium sp.]|uniref:TOBE domain-containing protein n=1 Tax=Aquabacterium sp. TaxID=1872578 RepID=UPI002E37A10C|nr:TOBE domain-containing protein [Aquabacterium sp.]HEX5357977.1 TOBE domain-containing protein [Aquabacterium sp.]
MKVSARNAFKGKISAIQPGAVNSEVTLKTDGGDTLVAIVTAGSVQSLGLSTGKDVVALVKAPWVMLATRDCGLTFSARNQLAGQVSTLIKGAVNTEVGITLPGGTEVFAVVTNEAVSELNLALGQAASAIIKASHIILAVPA